MNRTFLILTALLLAPLAMLHAQARSEITTDILIVGGTDGGAVDHHRA